MAGFGYQAVQPANFDVSDTIQRDQALRAQQAQTQAYEDERNKPKYDNVKLTAPSDVHYGAFSEAVQQLYEEKKEIDGITNRNERAARVNDWNAKKNELAMFSQKSAQWGQGIDKSLKDIKDGNYILEDKEAATNWKSGYTEAVPLTAKDGVLYMGDTPYSQVATDIFSDAPQARTVKESWLQGFQKGRKKGDYQVTGSQTISFDEEAFRTDYEDAVRTSLANGIPQSEIPSYEEVKPKYAFDSYNRFKPETDKTETDKTYSYGGYGGWTSKPTEKERPFIDAMLNTEPNKDGSYSVNVVGLNGKATIEDGEMTEDVVLNEVIIQKDGSVTVSAKMYDNSLVTLNGKEAMNAVNENFGTRWKDWNPETNAVQNKREANSNTSNKTKPENKTTTGKRGRWDAKQGKIVYD